jgi:nitrogenase-stabilizing/protective protein
MSTKNAWLPEEGMMMTMSIEDFEDDLDELSSAEDFLLYFNVEFEQRVVHVNRLHILQRYNDYLAKAKESMPESADAMFEVYAKLLTRAYQDFVDSDAKTEKVLKIYRMQEPQQTFVSIDMLKK